MTNQVYEFLDRLAVKGILPLYNNVMIPISRQEVADLLRTAEQQQEKLNGAESDFLAKFKREFIHEIDPSKEDAQLFFRDGFTSDMFSDKEKYLYAYADSSTSAYVEFIGSVEHRRISGDSRVSANTTLEEHGGRVRGTVKGKLGYFLQATDGTVFGDKGFALTDPRLQGNNKLKEARSTNFDFTEAYLRADLGWFNMEFGKERLLVGTGYSGRLLLSGNVPAFDAIKIDARYKALRFMFIHGSLVSDSAAFPGTLPGEPSGSNKYFAMHRVQLSLCDKFNLGLSEMTIYQRFSPDFAYLNPINFYKSAEHASGDRDNSFITIDMDVFPFNNYKLYGTLLIDDIDFSKIGTGWWGNELGVQGGIYAAEFAGCSNLDAIVEYTRIQPYVYSNRTSGIDYTNNGIVMGNPLGPNSDELFLQLQYRPAKSLRGWATYAFSRHGDNVETNGVIRNVGGNVLQGHRGTDSDVATFLDGNIVKTNIVQLQAAYEPINNFIITGMLEFITSTYEVSNSQARDRIASLKFQLEY